MRVAAIGISPWTRFDSRLGGMFKPGARVIAFKEGFGKYRINKYGYIGPAYAPERDKNSLRIALVGDSNIEGHMLFERHTLARILEEQLSGIQDKKVEVLNFSWSGPTFQRLYINYREWALRFNADYYLVFLGRKKLLKRVKESHPHCYLEDNRVKISYSREKRPWMPYRMSFSIYQQIDRAYTMFLQKVAEPISSNKNPPVFQDEDSHYEINRLILLAFQQINSREEHKIILVIENNIPEKYKSLISGFGEYTIDLSSQFDLMKKGGFDPYYWKATDIHEHWNHEAHQMAGNYLARQFVKRFVPTGK